MLLLVILNTLIITNAFCSNILVINAVESFSHHVWIETIVESLLENRHNITTIGHFHTKIQSENYTAYKMTGFDQILEDIDLTNQRNYRVFTRLMTLWNYVMFSSEIHLKSDALKLLLLYPRDKFDLIIFDITCGQEFYPVIEHFRNPSVIGVSPFNLPPHILHTMGSHFYFYFPHFLVDYTDDMSFLQRFQNTILYISEYFLKRYCTAKIYKRCQETYGSNITPFEQMERRIGLLLANYDPILDIAQPLPPNIIPVGGLHTKRAEKLPKDLLEILGKANNGVIYFSFGTIFAPSWLSVQDKKTFLNVFSKLNQTILWKYTGDDLKSIPKNVIIRKWYPQNDILAHKNVKLFINHGGILSAHEAMYHGVPILGIPMFSDQFTNIAKMTGRKIARTLLAPDLTEHTLNKSILEMLGNPIYKENIEKVSRKFRNQKEAPRERAIFWIEYALRNKDLNHLSPTARDMNLLQRENLDIYGAILLFVIIFVVCFLLIIKCVVNRLFFVIKPKAKQS